MVPERVTGRSPMAGGRHRPSNFYVIEAPTDQTLTVTANDRVNDTNGTVTFLVEPIDIFSP